MAAHDIPALMKFLLEAYPEAVKVIPLQLTLDPEGDPHFVIMNRGRWANNDPLFIVLGANGEAVLVSCSGNGCPYHTGFIANWYPVPSSTDLPPTRFDRINNAE